MKKPLIIVVIALIIMSVVLFIPTRSETIKAPFGEMKITIDLVYKDGTSKSLSIASNLYSIYNPMTIYHNGNEIDYIIYKVWVKAKGSFPYCEVNYKDSKVGYALYERDDGSYPNNPPLTMRTDTGNHQDSGGIINIPLNTGFGESGWFEMYSYRIEEDSVWTNAYTDSIDYKLNVFMNGPIQYRGKTDSYTGPWQTITGNPILISDVYISISSNGQPPPPDVFTVISGPEPDNLVSIVGVGSKTSVNGIATFELDYGQYSISISHVGYQTYQNFDVYINGPTTLGPISLTGSSGQQYSVVVATIPYADYIDCEGMDNDYFMSSCDSIGIGIFIVPEPGQYKCTAGWDDLDPHEKYKYAYPSDSIPTYATVIYWSQTSTISSFYILDSIEMDSSYEYNGYYLGNR